MHFTALTISYFSIYVYNFSARTRFSRKEILPWNKFRRVLFERVPSIINLPGELFRAIDVESADVLVPHDAEDMSCCSFARTLWKMEVFTAIVTVCSTGKSFHFDVSRLLSYAKCVLHFATEFYIELSIATWINCGLKIRENYELHEIHSFMIM